jgi:phosphoadenosine phosphosulfate reductase
MPVNISFSGGKDSLAALCLCLKVRPKPDVLFIDTGLEFPETVSYVHQLSDMKRIKLHVIAAQGDFFQEAQTFGPPAKDFRWCCKTHKLGPLASFIKEHYPKGCVTVEGRRIYESFNRSRINFIERNPYVPGQTTLCPIRNWNALEVMLYIYWNDLVPNPLYDEDFERIGCWLCPASLQSEFASLERTHPQMHEKWTASLRDFTDEKGLDPRYVDWGFWRWRKHPPKMLEIAKAHNIDLRVASIEKNEEEIGLDVVSGKSPCGLKYSIEAYLTVPQNHPFPAVANVLSMIGEVKYSEELGTAVIKANKHMHMHKDKDRAGARNKGGNKDEGRCTVFASGHIMIIAQKKEAEELLKDVVETVMRVQTCTRCGICEKRCKREAIKVGDTIVIDENRCNRCGRCAEGCIVAEGARKILRRETSANQ